MMTSFFQHLTILVFAIFQDIVRRTMKYKWSPNLRKRAQTGVFQLERSRGDRGKKDTLSILSKILYEFSFENL